MHEQSYQSVLKAALLCHLWLEFLSHKALRGHPFEIIIIIIIIILTREAKHLRVG